MLGIQIEFNYDAIYVCIWSIVTELRLLGSGGHLHQIKAIIISFCGLTENMLRDPWENLGTLTPKIEIFTTHLNYVW